MAEEAKYHQGYVDDQTLVRGIIDYHRVDAAMKTKLEAQATRACGGFTNNILSAAKKAGGDI